MIPPAFIQELLARVDIVDVVGRQVQLKKSGISLSGLCPFHAEKSPSFTVSPTRQTYHCFGCGVHGDAIRFLVEHNGLSFVDAVKDLAQQVGMTVPDDGSSPQDRERAAAQKQRRATLSDVLAKAAEHYRRQLKASPRAIEYLKGRGLTGEIAASFGLGYAGGRHGLASAFPHYDDPLLEESGLVIAKESAAGDEAQQERYDRFRDRIMFPIRAVTGEVIGFGGRVLDRGEPKYLNSPETPVFSKGRELYGLHEARTALRQRGYALVVEGYMDVVALAQSGFGNAVATLGTACTAEHVQKLFRFTDTVVFSFDGDAAGRRAATRALEASLPHASDTRTVRFLFLPPEHDPDSFVRAEGAAAFEACVAAAVPLSRQLLEAAAEGCDLDAAEGRARLVAQALPLIAQLPEGLLRGQILDDLAIRARVPVDDLKHKLEAVRIPRGNRPGTGAAARGSGAGRVPDPPPDDPDDPGRWAPPDDAGERPGAARTTAQRPAFPLRRPLQRRLSPMATGLDRAVSLLLQRSDLWEPLGHEAHALLTAQPDPHGAFFAWLDRVIHDQGALAPDRLVGTLRDSGGPALAELESRIGTLHAMPAGEAVRRELEAVLDQLRSQGVKDELERIAASGDLSPAAKARHRELLELLKQLKERLTAQSADRTPPDRAPSDRPPPERPPPDR